MSLVYDPQDSIHAFVGRKAHVKTASTHPHTPTVPAGGAVALTFDDGPDPVWTPRVLEALRRANAKATFFVTAPLARRYPATISDMRAEGHAVELHCARHIRHTEQGREQVESDTRSALRDLREMGVAPRFWRPPWGVLAPWTPEVAENFGLELVSWTADTHDWRGDTAPEMLRAVESDLRPGAVVLMHDGLGPGARRAGCGETVALVGPLVARARSLGLEPATIDSNLGVPFARSGTAV